MSCKRIKIAAYIKMYVFEVDVKIKKCNFCKGLNYAKILYLNFDIKISNVLYIMKSID